MKKVLFVSGMHCDHCKNRVEAAIDTITGAKATVNLKKNFVDVVSEVEISDDVLKEAITQAGYTVTKIEDSSKKSGFPNLFRKG